MKVLHIIPSVAPVRGGPSQAVLEMVKALRDSGIDAEIATTNDNGVNLLDVPLGQYTEYQQVPIWFFPRFSPRFHGVREFAFSREFTTWLWQSIHQYDLLHIHAIFSYASTAAMVIARWQKIPYIVRPLGQLCKWCLSQSSHKKQIYLQLIEKANLNHSQGIHFTSKQEEQEASKLNLTSPSFILPHGLAIPAKITDAHQRLRQYFNLPVDEPIILFLSRLHPKKGLDYLIPALSKLSNYRFTFILAGSGEPDYENEIKSLIVNYGMDKRTYFTGFVKDELKNLFIQGADLFTLTSYSENFGLSVLEALAGGLPVLITPGVALAEMVKQEQVGYVTPLDVAAITITIQQFLDNPQLGKKMGVRARKFILEKYTWDEITYHLQQVYTHIVKNQSIPTFY